MTSEKTDRELLSLAIDEIWRLRTLAASEARILEAHLDYRTFPKSRRRFAEESVERLRDAARGRARAYDESSAKREYRSLTGTQTLTNSQWIEEAKEIR